MEKDRYKLWVLGLMTVAFIGYSFQLYIVPPAEKSEEITSESLVAEGKMLWQQKNCTSCHQFYGLGGHLGPDLTNVSSKRPPEYIEAFIKNGTDVMPNYGLNQKEVDALMAFLAEVDQSGQSDPRTFKLNLDGTITQ